MSLKRKSIGASWFSVFALSMSIIGFAANGYGQKSGKVSVENLSNNSEAKRIWELAIRAKGGREKLHSIKSMVTTSRAEVARALSGNFSTRVETLFVFPNKRWAWRDYRPSVFGLTMQMYDYAKGLKYHQVFGTETDGKLVPFEESERWQIGENMPRIAIELMETYWLRPIPRNVSEAKVKGKNVQIIQTDLDGTRIDFVVSQDAHLPLQVNYYYYDAIGKKTRVNTYDLSNYVPIEGVMMATTIKAEGETGSETTTFQFNVDFNEDIFEKPPRFEDGPQAWKRKPQP